MIYFKYTLVEKLDNMNINVSKCNIKYNFDKIFQLCEKIFKIKSYYYKLIDQFLFQLKFKTNIFFILT